MRPGPEPGAALSRRPTRAAVAAALAATLTVAGPTPTGTETSHHHDGINPSIHHALAALGPAPAEAAVNVEAMLDARTVAAASRTSRALAVPRSLQRGRSATAYALRQRGKPYRFGASGPNAYDCSGLTMASWRRLSVLLPHSAAGQARRGRPVAARNRQTGDLVLWPGHVGIYYQRGYVVDAPHPGASVRLRKIWGSPRYRRVG
jgi:cell wall-associated NlpC family hydrolase